MDALTTTDEEQDSVPMYKLALIGDSGVGKTCILLRFAEGGFNTSFMSTIGVDYKVKSTIVNGEQIKLQIWDTAGQERFRNIAPVYFRGADGLMLVLDVTSETSFDNVRNWMTDIDKHVEKASVQKILVGNKADVSAAAAEDTAVRVVTEERARALASEYGVPYIETSARDNHNINEAFMQLATSIKKVTEDLAAAAARDGGEAASAAAGSDGAEVHPLVLTAKPQAKSGSGGCC